MTAQTCPTVGRRRLRARGTTVVVAAGVSVGLGFQAATPAQAGLLSPIVGVVSTLLDTTLGLLTGADWGYSSTQTSMQQVAQSIGVDTMWSRGYTGSGIGVALVDTGVVPVQGLNAPGKVINGPDLSFESQAPALRNLDGFGHGTHLAGIIAGNDATTGGFSGVAPGSTLLNMRVGTSSGAADVSQVIAAVDWVVQHRNDPGLNIRVLNLAFGTNSTQAAQLDPLAHALENAWRAGIVVVASGGNKGSTQPSLDDPAIDPWVIAVGAEDISGSGGLLGGLTGGSIPAFSSRGSNTRHVDVVAPGQSIVSLKDPGSYVDSEYPGAEVGTRFFKGSGTSQAAAVVSGAVAVLLQQRPTLTPNQVKQLLMTTARPSLLVSSSAQGSGLINIAAAASALTPLTTQSWPKSTGTGTLQSSRGSLVLNDGNADLTGEKDIFGAAFSSSSWAAQSSANVAWNGGTWDGSMWAATGWTGSSWATKTWGSVSWPKASWGGISWSSRSWSGESWASRSWSGTGWVSRSWSSRSWSGAYWG